MADTVANTSDQVGEDSVNREDTLEARFSTVVDLGRGNGESVSSSEGE